MGWVNFKCKTWVRIKRKSTYKNTAREDYVSFASYMERRG